ncbi:hypothetical protein [Terrarubrum flagellatum]|uniref:hypothetical protein n=1 Tax=Terrirubrum flagellatum TaxID=2895980 RepID=UPI003144D4C0
MLNLTTDITDFKGLIAAMGGPSGASDATGIDRRALCNMSSRNAASSVHWRDFAAGAAKRGIPVDERDFARWEALAKVERELAEAAERVAA